MREEKIRPFLERKKYLISLEKRIEKKLRFAPEGSLRISENQGSKQYYHRALPSDRNGKYISKSNMKLVTRLAQKSYNQKLLNSIKSELIAIDNYMRFLPEQFAEDVYSKLREDRKVLVAPEIETDEIFLANWESQEYSGKSFSDDSIELYSERGERVRSKSELIIANLLNKYKVPYRYECPVVLRGYGTVYPDFTILIVSSRREIYWEHQGMMDDPEYVAKAIKKVSSYIKSGIFPGERLILTSETRQSPIDVRVIELMIKHLIEG